MRLASAPLPGPVIVMGAGLVGSYLGGRLMNIGAQVLFVGRGAMLQALQSHGLTVSDLSGFTVHHSPQSLNLASSIEPEFVSRLMHAPTPAQTPAQTPIPEPAPTSAQTPALVLLCVKTGATAQAARQLHEALPPGTLVLSMQNGVSNARLAQEEAPHLRVLPGMVPYNIAELAPGHVHRGTDGRLAAQDDAALRPWLAAFEAAGLPLSLHHDMAPVLWGKLLLNLNNPVNALCGLPLKAQLLDRGYRRVLAELMAEAIRVLRHAGIKPAQLTPLPAAWLPRLMRLPTPLFKRLAARMLRIDDKARSSMAEDLQRGRATEIDALCGEVARLAQRSGIKAPLNAAMVTLLHEAVQQPSPIKLPMSADDLLKRLRGGTQAPHGPV